MVKMKELTVILLAVILMSLIICFNNREISVDLFMPALAVSLIIIFTCFLAKKAVARHIDVGIDAKIIPFQRWWITTYAHFKKAIPGGIIFPLVFALVSGGAIKLLAFLSFDSKALPSKTAKKYGLRRYSSMMDWDDSLISFWSLVAVMILASIAKFLSFYINLSELLMLSRYSLYYIAWNLIPLGQMDGSRIFFGSRPLYVFSLVLAAVTFLIVFF